MAAFYKTQLAGHYCNVAAATLMGCEYLVHLPREVNLFWRSSITGASVLFFANRYLSLLSQALQLVSPTSDKSCSDVVKANQTIFLLPYLPFAVFSSLRTYALCEGRIRLPLAVFVGLFSVAPVGMNLVNYIWLTSVIDPIFDCLETVNVSVDLEKYFTIACRTCSIVADLVVLGITWRATYRTSKMVRVAASEMNMHTFAGTLLRDGTVYFLVLVSLNILHLTFTMLSISSDSLQFTSDVTLFTIPITSVLVSRFVLNLQEVYQYRAGHHLSSLSSGQTSINFARVIGSLGSSLLPPEDTSLEDERLESAWDDHNEQSEEGGQKGDAIVAAIPA